MKTYNGTNRAELKIPLFLSRGDLVGSGSPTNNQPEPVTVSVPFPKGALPDPRSIRLLDPDGNSVVVQTEVLARWTGGSVKWLRLDFLGATAERPWEIAVGEPREGPVKPVGELTSPKSLLFGAGGPLFEVKSGPTRRLLSVTRGERVVGWVGLTFREDRNEVETLQIEQIAVEANGPICTRVRVVGRFDGRSKCRFFARFTAYASSGLLRADVTLHNPRRAKHPGGLWDLGDPGSILFREFALKVAVDEPFLRVDWTDQAAAPLHDAGGTNVEIYQESSGGENWHTRTHVNRLGQIPQGFPGYRVRTAESVPETTGARANPLVSAETVNWRLEVAVSGFWQEFPKAIHAQTDHIKVCLFPGQFPDAHELQGGERKTHTVWLDFADRQTETNLSWVYNPIVAHMSPEWYATSGAIRDLSPAIADQGNPLDALLTEAGGPEGLVARREIIDEYGWRNFGEVYADHEAAYYKGPPPCISHYNNQYDMIRGFALQFLRTGDPRWVELFEPLAKHVADIDIYHTREDKAAYNGGLFWFTDHYKDAATCTHRTYSKANCQSGDTSYGGGPSAAHNFSAGLLLAHYLTGNTDFRAAVLELADWVIAMDDGRKTPLGLIDRGPTGLASFTFDPAYHGPGRGAGNSIAVLLDGWQVSGKRHYLEKVEELIRRTIHPEDDVTARDLLNVELRWSYTIFLTSLARYLDDKSEAEEYDLMYGYARASLVRYALWMLAHERPYFDHREQLEYPTEAWAGQELRKGNVLRLAARHTEGPVREDLARRGDELAARAWSDLFGFKTRSSARALALAMGEGSRDVALRGRPIESLPGPSRSFEFGLPQAFVSQKHRVLAPLRAAKRMIRR